MGKLGVPFPKGKSGNPGGRPKRRDDLTARCIRAVDEHVVEKWVNEVTQHGEEWLEASKLLAAYGYGKPTERVEAKLEVRDDSDGLTLAELREVARIGVQQRLAQRADDDDEPATH